MLSCDNCPVELARQSSLYMIAWHAYLFLSIILLHQHLQVIELKG